MTFNSKLKMKTCMSILVAAAGVAAAGGAQALDVKTLYLFGDSYTDTGAYVKLTNGSTAGGYLASAYDLDLVTSKSTNPGTSSINFAESGARIAQGPSGSAIQPRSLTQQVGEFQSYLQAGKLSFDPNSSLFFLLGGLNDHASPTAPLASATMQQVATLYGLGGRYFELALLPSMVPAFTDSANNVNPMITQLVPELQAMYPDASFTLSNWGDYYDDILRNPQNYGITNTTNACLGNAACTDPDTYFYYYSAHPSDRAHEIVGAQLYAEAQAIATIAAVPEPGTIALMASGIGAISLIARRRRRAMLV